MIASSLHKFRSVENFKDIEIFNDDFHNACNRTGILKKIDQALLKFKCSGQKVQFFELISNF